MAAWLLILTGRKGEATPVGDVRSPADMSIWGSPERRGELACKVQVLEPEPGLLRQVKLVGSQTSHGLRQWHSRAHPLLQ